MRIIGSFDPSAAASGTIQVGAADAGAKVKLKNLSLINIKLDFQNGKTDLLNAGEVNYWTMDAYTPEISWSQFSILSAAPPPISECSVIVYDADEGIGGTYPTSLIHQINVGNAAPLSSSTTSIANDGNAAANVVEASLVGSPQSNILIKNDGTVMVQEYVATIITTLLQILPGNNTALKIGALNRLVEVLGSLKVDQDLTIGGSLNTAGVNVYGSLSAVSGGTVNATSVPATGVTAGALPAGVTIPSGQVVGAVGSANTLLGGANLPGGNLGISANGDLLTYNGTNLRLISAGGVIARIGTTDITQATMAGLQVLTGKISYPVAGSIHGWQIVSGTGPATVSHGLGSPPNFVSISGNNTTGSFGYNNPTNTTVGINAPAGVAWVALIITT